MTQVGDRHLAERAVIISQSDPAIEDSRMVILAETPSARSGTTRSRASGRVPASILSTPAQRDEPNPQPVELTELGVGRQLGVEDQFLGIPPGPVLPELDEAEDLGILLVLAQFAVGVAEDAGVGVLHQEGQDAFLGPTRLET